MRFPLSAMVVTVLVLLTGCAPRNVRFATFNASLNRDRAGQLLADLSTPDNQQAKNVAEVIQRVAPDVLLINEFDFDPDGKSIAAFQKNYLSVSQNGASPIEYKYVFVAPVNTGALSGFDLDRNGVASTQPGTRDYGGDCWGFGLFPGQYGMAILSRFPIDRKGTHTFQAFRWNDMPGAMLPRAKDDADWYPPETLASFPLSSKSHWDVPIRIGGKTVHLLAAHPTPPAFDGAEDRNGKRNHDEIRLWAEYLTRGTSGFLYNDQVVLPKPADGNFCSTLRSPMRKIEQPKPVPPPDRFVIVGDYNADPNDGGSVPGAIGQLLNHPRVNGSFVPRSAGAEEASAIQKQNNTTHKSPAAEDTADFSDRGDAPGNLRCDYVLPSRNLTVLDGGVFWPATTDPLSRLVKMEPKAATSDHRLVWIDVSVK